MYEFRQKKRSTSEKSQQITVNAKIRGFREFREFVIVVYSHNEHVRRFKSINRYAGDHVSK